MVNKQQHATAVAEQIARRAWQRPELRRLDASDAETGPLQNAFDGNPGSQTKS